MEQVLRDKLLKGEKVIWKGKATSFKLLEPPYGIRIIVTWIICALIGIVLPILYINSMNAQGVEVSKLALGVFICIPLFFALRPVFDKRKIEKKATYVITNMRAIAFYGSDAFHSIFLDKITRTRVDPLPSGAGVIWIGEEACSSHISRGRIAALIGAKNDKHEILGLVFYSVENPNMVIKHFLPRCA